MMDATRGVSRVVGNANVDHFLSRCHGDRVKMKNKNKNEKNNNKETGEGKNEISERTL